MNERRTTVSTFLLHCTRYTYLKCGVEFIQWSEDELQEHIEQLCDRVGQQLCDRVGQQLCDRVGQQLCDRVGQQLCDRVGQQLCDRVGQQLCDRVGQQLRGPLHTSRLFHFFVALEWNLY